jgi:hypothetical protein
MDSEEIISKTLETLDVKNMLPLAYNDILHPAAVEVGKNLLVVAKCVSLALSPLSASVWGFEKIRDWLVVRLTEKLARTPEARIQSPSVSIAGPVLLQLTFCKEQNELKELYASLLARAMDSQLSLEAHPAFVYVIQQLTPDEAVVLRWISEEEKDGGSLCVETTNEEASLRKGTDWLESQFRGICERAGVVHLDLTDTYLENLLRLGLLTKNYWNNVDYVPEKRSEEEDHGPYVRLEQSKELYVTPFGRQFMRICVKETV